MASLRLDVLGVASFLAPLGLEGSAVPASERYPVGCARIGKGTGEGVPKRSRAG